MSNEFKKIAFDFEKDNKNDKEQYKILNYDIPDLYFLKNSKDNNYSSNKVKKFMDINIIENNNKNIEDNDTIYNNINSTNNNDLPDNEKIKNQLKYLKCIYLNNKYKVFEDNEWKNNKLNNNRLSNNVILMNFQELLQKLFTTFDTELVWNNSFQNYINNLNKKKLINYLYIFILIIVGLFVLISIIIDVIKNTPNIYSIVDKKNKIIGFFIFILPISIIISSLIGYIIFLLNFKQVFQYDLIIDYNYNNIILRNIQKTLESEKEKNILIRKNMYDNKIIRLDKTYSMNSMNNINEVIDIMKQVIKDNNNIEQGFTYFNPITLRNINDIKYDTWYIKNNILIYVFNEINDNIKNTYKKSLNKLMTRVLDNIPNNLNNNNKSPNYIGTYFNNILKNIDKREIFDIFENNSNYLMNKSESEDIMNKNIDLNNIYITYDVNHHFKIILNDNYPIRLFYVVVNRF